jgi:hypothetical protein
MQPEAERHFQRDLDRGRSAVGEEYMFERGRRDRDEPLRELFGRRMREAGEDDLVEQARLCPDRRHDWRITVTMRHDPP